MYKCQQIQLLFKNNFSDQYILLIQLLKIKNLNNIINVIQQTYTFYCFLLHTISDPGIKSNNVYGLDYSRLYIKHVFTIIIVTEIFP